MNKNFTNSLYLKATALVFIFIVSISIKGYSQKQANVWYFGNGMGLNFNAGAVPTQLTATIAGQHLNDVDEGHATVSDDNGNFLFYTNGEQIWDKNFAVMQNGTGLMGHWSATQCATIFPLPGNTKPSHLAKYVVLTTPVENSGSTGIRYNIVDMDPSTNGGYATGAVVSKNNVMPNAPTSVTEGLASCPHFNGADEWVVGHDENNRFYAWKISSDALGNIVVSNPQVSTIGNAVAGITILKFNSCFNRIALTYTKGSPILQVFSFDNSTGVVGKFDSNPAGVNDVLKLDVSATINGSTGAALMNYGVEFSPSGKYIFVSQAGQLNGSARTQRLYRYDLTAGSPTPTKAAIEASRTSIFEREGTDNAHRIGHLQLAPNGKIYMTHMYTFWGGDGKLSVINNPNDNNPNFSLESITWPSNRSSMGLPSFHKGFLAGRASLFAADSTGTTSISDMEEICQGIATKFESMYTGSATNYTWDMNAPHGVNPFYGTSADKTSAYHKYTAAGDYLVVVTMQDEICGYTVSDTTRIKVNPTINTTGTASCGEPISLTVTSLPTAGKNYVWYSDAALTTPIAHGASATVPAPLTSNLYVKEVETITITPVLVTAAIPAKPAVTDSISRTAAITYGTPHSTSTGPGASTATTAAAPAKTTLQVTNPVTLNSFRFAITGGWSSATVQYTVTIKNSGGTIVYGPSVVSGDVRVDGGLNPDGASTRINFSGNSRRYFVVKPAINLPVDNYTIEIYKSGGTAASTTHYLELFSTTLANPSIAGSITNLGNGSSQTFLFNINVTTSYIPEVPAVYKDVITSTNKACSYGGAVPVFCALPVEFIYVKANSNGEVNWATSSEFNNSHFIVEKSYDGINFHEIGQVKASGNTNTISNYSYIDNKIAEGDVYYRIMQIDYDGQFSYSNIVAVQYTRANDLIIYPNPNNGEFSIRVNQRTESDITVEIVNILGSTIYTDVLPMGGNVVDVKLPYLAKGTYLVKTKSEFNSSVKKLIIE